MRGRLYTFRNWCRLVWVKVAWSVLSVSDLYLPGLSIDSGGGGKITDLLETLWYTLRFEWAGCSSINDICQGKHVYNHGGSKARARSKLILDADGSCANFVRILMIFAP